MTDSAYDQQVVKAGLVIRAGYDTSSDKLGELGAGINVTVHDEMDMGDVVRARIVVKDGPLRGREGFVTKLFTSGEKGLSDPPNGASAFASSLPQEALDAARVAFEVFDADGSGSLSTTELRMILARPTSEGSTNLSDAEIDQIIAAFDVNGDGELQFEEFAVMWAPTSPEPRGEAASSSDDDGTRGEQRDGKGKRKAQFERQKTSGALSQLMSHSFAKEAKAAAAMFSFKHKAIDSLGVGKSNGRISVLGLVEATVKSRKSAKKASKKDGVDATSAPKVTPSLSAMELTTLSRAMSRKLELCERQASVGQTLESALGAILSERNVKLDQIVREWDVMSSGEISRVEFRKALRDPKLGVPAVLANVDQIDALFDSLDEDHGGTLDVHEMKAALKMFKARAKARRNEEQMAAGLVDTCRQRLSQIEAVLEMQSRLEELNATLTDLRVILGKDEPQAKGAKSSGVQLEMRLYGAMVKRNVKVNDLVSSWDKDKDGSIDEEEFARNMTMMVPSATDDEVSQLFERLDAKGRGELDLEDFRNVLRNLERRSLKARDEERALSAQVKELKTAASGRQSELLAAIEQDEAEELSREKAAAKVQEAENSAKAEAKEQAKVARAARAAQIAEEKAAFEARVNEKREKKNDKPHKKPSPRVSTPSKGTPRRTPRRTPRTTPSSTPRGGGMKPVKV